MWVKQARKVSCKTTVTGADNCNRGERLDSTLLKQKGGEFLSSWSQRWKSAGGLEQGGWSRWWGHLLLFFQLLLNFITVALQCRVSFCYTAKRISSHIHTSTPLWILSLHTSLPSAEDCSLRYAVGPCWVPLYVSTSISPFTPLPLSLVVIMFVFYICDSNSVL